MSTKPTLADARWADLGGANRLSPASGLRDTGFLNNTLAIPEYVNEELYQLYLWAQYLSDGDIDLDDVTANSLTLDTFLTVNGSATFNDAVVIDDPFGLTVLGPIGVGDIGCADVTSSGDVSANNLLFNTPRVLGIPAMQSVVTYNDDLANVASRHPLHSSGGWRVCTSHPDFILYPINLPVGSIITETLLYFEKGTGYSIGTGIYKQDSVFSSPVFMTGSGNSSAATGVSNVYTPGLNILLDDPLMSYHLRVDSGAPDFVNGDKVGNLFIRWKMPA